jgi:ketosteroid isomerase-like protein
MKRVNLIVLALAAISLLLVLPAWSQGGNPPASTKESGATSGHGMTAVEQTGEAVADEIKKMETERAAAVVKGDWAKLAKETSDDYTLININGQMSNKSQMVDGFKSGRTKLTTDDVSDMNVRVYGNVAVVTGKVDVKGTIGGKAANGQAMFTRVYVKKAGHWQAVALQQTPVSP